VLGIDGFRGPGVNGLVGTTVELGEPPRRRAGVVGSHAP
jgi:hypothetical protein